MTDRPIISLHLPKTAGTSLRMAWRRAIGPEKILFDYGDPPADPCSTIHLDPDYYDRHPVTRLGRFRVVHGHFPPSKYAAVGDALRVTFLREPVANVVSIYFFWMRFVPPGNALQEYARSRRLTIEEFALLPIIRRLYGETYFGRFPIERFDFVGDQSRFGEEVARLSALIGIELDGSIKTNTSDEAEAVLEGDAAEWAARRRDALADDGLLSRLRGILADDVRLYEEHAGR
ncbi:MAG: hypothetical protein AAGG07_09280 [Planctomycetota bacterium]